METEEISMIHMKSFVADKNANASFSRPPPFSFLLFFFYQLQLVPYARCEEDSCAYYKLHFIHYIFYLNLK